VRGVLLVAAIGSALAIAGAPRARQVPVGSTTVAGPADSLFERFTLFLQERNCAITALDRPRRTVTATLPSAPGEAAVFRFEPRGDSTRIVAAGVRGGVLPLIMGLGLVNDMLKEPRARPDSSPAGPPPTSPLRGS
jgi:hypothetical protein